MSGVELETVSEKDSLETIEELSALDISKQAKNLMLALKNPLSGYFEYSNHVRISTFVVSYDVISPIAGVADAVCAHMADQIPGVTFEIHQNAGKTKVVVTECAPCSYCIHKRSSSA